MLKVANRKCYVNLWNSMKKQSLMERSKVNITCHVASVHRLHISIVEIVIIVTIVIIMTISLQLLSFN